jgi:hypothetical protein
MRRKFYETSFIGQKIFILISMGYRKERRFV